jgi:hypothetical protein
MNKLEKLVCYARWSGGSRDDLEIGFWSSRGVRRLGADRESAQGLSDAELGTPDRLG